MCKDAGVEALLTGTSNHKRVSTLYDELSMPECDREFFYSHMGHSAAVNKGIYQLPIPNQEVLKVGRHYTSLMVSTVFCVTQLNCYLVQHV